MSVPESPFCPDAEGEGEEGSSGRKSETGPAWMYPSGAVGIVDVIEKRGRGGEWGEGRRKARRVFRSEVQQCFAEQPPQQPSFLDDHRGTLHTNSHLGLKKKKD
jgi:hypothetical protein